MKRTLRKLVLATSAYPVFSQLYRGVYRSIVGGLGLWARLHGEVVGLYVRGSYARGCYVPGRSDLDFVLVLRQTHDDQERFRFLRRVRAGCQRLRRIVPILGEVEILAEPHFRQWLSLVHDRCQIQAVFGPEVGPFRPPSDLEKTAQALSDYVFIFLPNITLWERLERQRLAQKIFKNCGQKQAPLESDPWELASAVCTRVEEACRDLEWDAPNRPWSLQQRVASCPLPHWLNPWRGQLAGVIASPFDASECLVVVEDNSVSCFPRDLVRAVCEHSDQPRLLGRASLRCFLNLVSPLQAMSLVADRAVWGSEDLIADVGFQERYFHDGMKRSAALILSRICTFELPSEDLEMVLLGWFFRVKRYLEDGAQEVYFHEILEHYEIADPELYDRLRACLERPDAVRDFELMRILADDLSRSLGKEKS